MDKARAWQELLKQPAASLQEILDAKERRVEKQRELLQNGKSLICFTLNIPGAIKCAPLFERGFMKGKDLILQQLHWQNCEILQQDELRSAAGYELFLLCNEDALTVKKWMIPIETDRPIGRLMDIDVLNSEGIKISRADIGMEPRKCLLCDNIAAACSRSRAHSYEELLQETVRILADTFTEEFLDKTAANAARALLYEVATTPKPGLVDRSNSGSHKDMDIFTFIDSTAVLTPYFRRFAEKGMEFSTMAPSEVLQHLRYPGRCAEAAMLEMTKGVNSHKGIVFSMGVICTAMGMLYGQGKALIADEILDLSGEICSSLMDDFKQMKEPHSYGEKLYAEHGISGIRGEASQGYPSVRNVGLPAMRKYLNQGMSLNDAGAWTLLELLSATEDSNIITRSDVTTLRSVQQQVREVLNKNDRSEELLNELDREFIAKNISPGGCADLLALTYFLYFTEQ